MIYSFGYLEDEPDARDHYGSFGAPSSGSVRIDTRAPLDQQSTGSCVAHACARLMTTMAPELPELSPWFIYRNALLITTGGRYDILYQYDSGTYIRSALKRMASIGCATLETEPLPQDLNRMKTPQFSGYQQPSLAALMSAYEHRALLTGYYRVTNGDEAIAALQAGHPIVGGFDVGREWFDPPAILEPTQHRSGGHAVLIHGYDASTDSFEFLNSWGDNWRCPGSEPGHGRMSRACFEAGHDLWTGTVQWAS